MSFKIWLVYFSALAFLFVSSSHFLVLCWLSVFPLWGTYSCLWCYFHNSCIRVILALVPVNYLFHANWVSWFFGREVILDCFLLFWKSCVYLWVLFKFYGNCWHCSFSSQLTWLASDYKVHAAFGWLWIQAQFSVQCLAVPFSFAPGGRHPEVSLGLGKCLCVGWVLKFFFSAQ